LIKSKAGITLLTKSTAMTNIFTLRNYSLAAGAFLISVAPMGGDSSTDISYTDLDPDISLDPNLVGPDEIDIETYQIDLNGDGINDVSFSARFNNFITSWYFVPVMENEIMAKPLGNVELGIDTDPIPGTLPNWEYPNAYNMGDMLDDGLNWCGSGAGCVDAYFQGLVCEYDLDDFDSRGADWLGAQFKYIAIRVENAGNKYYGWIRLSIDKKADKVVIHDYAISNEPNTPIIAGDRGNCAPPSVNSGAGIGTTTAKVKWAPVFEAISYKLRYRIAGTGSWNYQTIPGAAHFKNLAGLACDTEYEWQIAVLCADSTKSAYSSLHTFTTSGCKMAADDNSAAEIVVYPNPAADLFIIEGITTLPAKVQVSNLSGMLHYDKTIENNTPVEIDISDWNLGTYIITISSEQGVITKKLTKTK